MFGNNSLNRKQLISDSLESSSFLTESSQLPKIAIDKCPKMLSNLSYNKFQFNGYHNRHKSLLLKHRRVNNDQPKFDISHPNQQNVSMEGLKSLKHLQHLRKEIFDPPALVRSKPLQIQIPRLYPPLA